MQKNSKILNIADVLCLLTSFALTKTLFHAEHLAKIHMCLFAVCR